jgi:hypothetical protein
LKGGTTDELYYLFYTKTSHIFLSFFCYCWSDLG